MGYLELWLMSYLDEVHSQQVCWRDGQCLVEALASIDPGWFSKLRYPLHDTYNMDNCTFSEAR